MPNGQIKKGVWEGNKRLDWIELSEEEKEQEKKNYDKAVKEINGTHVIKGGIERILGEAQGAINRMREKFEKDKFPDEEQVEKQIQNYKSGQGEYKEKQ